MESAKRSTTKIVNSECILRNIKSHRDSNSKSKIDNFIFRNLVDKDFIDVVKLINFNVNQISSNPNVEQ